MKGNDKTRQGGDVASSTKPGALAPQAPSTGNQSQGGSGQTAAKQQESQEVLDLRKWIAKFEEDAKKAPNPVVKRLHLKKADELKAQLEKLTGSSS